MLKTSVYIEVSNASPRKTDKRYGYVLEAEQNGQLVTRAGFGSVTGTYHQAVLTAMIEALKRYDKPSEVHLVCANGFVLGQLKNLQMWLKNDFRTSKGKPVANQEEWRKLACLTAQHKIITEQMEKSSYTGWLKMKLKDKEEIQDV